MKNIQKLTLSLLLATLSVSLFSAADDRFGKKSFDEKFLSHIKKHSIGLFCAYQLQANTKLLDAVEENNIKAAQEALDAGANICVNTTKSFYGGCPLQIAVGTNNKEMVQLLLDNGVVKKTIDNSGSEALVRSISHGYQEIAKLLIHNGIDIEKESYNITPFCAAIERGDKCSDVISLLIQQGTSINSRSFAIGRHTLYRLMYGMPLHGAAMYAGASAQLLLDAGADLAVIAENGQTLKEYALYLDNTYPVKTAEYRPAGEFIRLIKAEEQKREDFYAGRGSECAEIQALTSLFSDEANLIEKEVAQEITDYVLPDRFVRLLELKKKRDARQADASAHALGHP